MSSYVFLQYYYCYYWRWLPFPSVTWGTCMAGDAHVKATFVGLHPVTRRSRFSLHVLSLTSSQLPAWRVSSVAASDCVLVRVCLVLPSSLQGAAQTASAAPLTSRRAWAASACGAKWQVIGCWATTASPAAPRTTTAGTGPASVRTPRLCSLQSSRTFSWNHLMKTLSSAHFAFNVSWRMLKALPRFTSLLSFQLVLRAESL